MKATTCVLLAFFQVITYIPGNSAKYVGGTVATIPAEVLGELSTADQKVLSFDWAKTRTAEGGVWSIAYSQVTGLAYGQHAGRRVGASAAVLASTGGLGAPALVPLLLVKKRRHYLTIEFLDEHGKKQGAIFLVGKNAIGSLLDELENKTGKATQFEDEEARKTRER
jgi:hypothetical protein